MKVGKKLGVLLLVLLMLAGMMTAVSAKVYTDLYDGLGSFDTESDYQSFAKDYVNLTAYRAMKTHSYYNDNGNGCMRVTRDASATEQGRFHLNTSFQPGKTYAIGFKAKDLDETETEVWVYSEAAKPRIEHGGTTTITGNLEKNSLSIILLGLSVVMCLLTQAQKQKPEPFSWDINPEPLMII